MNGPFLNGDGYKVPDNTILVVPNSLDNDGWYKEIIMPLRGEVKRDWFNSHFYYCLPLNIGNQYGFVIRSLKDFEMHWDGTYRDATLTFLNDDNDTKQVIQTGFGQGIVTIQNHFSLKTPVGINLMTIQPPNMFISGCAAMTGVVEADQIKRDFTFNLKITVPNMTIRVKKGDALGAFIPIPRYFVEKFDTVLATDIFDEELVINENIEADLLSKERQTDDTAKPHQAGRRYFNGVNSDGSPYDDHQKRLT